MNKDIIKQELLSEIEKSDCFTFADLVYFFEDRDINPHGDQYLGYPDLNIYFLVGLSEEVTVLIKEMLLNEELFLGAVDREIYNKIGTGVLMPATKKLTPSGGYKKKHWQPVIFRTKGVCE
ncbi:hypothetical protein SPSIL_020070 [Sporomusa silvacetica DSM 10669]|uniref:Uncharacterized protein n=1 Tax=Sporomusa silvacetica DSM 10669 TaxID=1123289 RepID=A0ABZ3IJI4_9FIRM|nr:hypothetical protein [Sporomusa silvacetica]OZC18740.1 hypothetical protein SPSIL_23490 [Sporomusa silvacetica DSM 10669]